MVKDLLISKEDKSWVNEYKWFVAKNGYLVRNVKLGFQKWTQHYLHREIAERMGLGIKNRFVDHINRNKLDCRRENLRSVTATESTYNTGRLGVTWDKSKKKWYARVYKAGKLLWWKRFNDFNLALTERNKVKKQYYGEFV